MDGEETFSEALSESEELSESDELPESDVLSESDELSEEELSEMEEDDDDDDDDDDEEEMSEDETCKLRRSRFAGGCACTRSPLSRLRWPFSRVIVLAPGSCSAEKY